MNQVLYENAVGEYCEGDPWQILKDEVFWIGPSDRRNLCSHAQRTGNVDTSGYEEIRVSRVIQCWNESGHNSTCLCLDCLLEGVKLLEAQAHEGKTET